MQQKMEKTAQLCKMETLLKHGETQCKRLSLKHVSGFARLV
jgi:hypothetical protein